MRRAHLALIFAVAVGIYLPTVRYGFVQDDRPIIALNPAVRSLPVALAGFDDPYWPPPSQAGLYRPLTIVSFAVDWAISGGRPGWFHVMNAAWHGAAAVLIALILARWLPGIGAVAAGLVFAVHPVHVEGVASLVSRSELLAAIGMLGAVLCTRRRWWVAAVLAAGVAMFSKEHGVVTGLLVLAADRLEGADQRRYPWPFYGALAAVTVVFLIMWWRVGREATGDMAPAFYGTDTVGRLALALPAILRAATLLAWPLNLSADYGPQVIAVRSGLSLAALAGLLVVGGGIWLAVWSWRRHPPLAFVTVASLLAYLPTSNLLFPAGVVLSERNLYLPVLLVSGLVGVGAVAAGRRWGVQPAAVAVGLLVTTLALRSELRMPAWENNWRFLVTTLAEHPESYRAHVWAAAVLASSGDTAAARREYLRAEGLFDRDPHLHAAHAYFLMSLGDTVAAAPRIDRARLADPREPFALRARLLLLLARRDRAGAQALADTALGWSRWDQEFYQDLLR